jgi:hypothetical protein
VDIRSLGSDSGLHKARAVGLARGDGQETLASAGHGTGAVVGVASIGSLINETSHGGGDKGQDNSGLHVCGVWACLEGRRVL